MWLLTWLACGDGSSDPHLDSTGDPALQRAVNGTCAPEGEAFLDRYSCEGVQGQSPTTEATASAQVAAPDPSRLEDPDLAWSAGQLESCSCVCCHVSEGIAGYSWAADFAPAWTDSASDGALSSLAGPPPHFLEILPPEENHGFERELTGMPSTDPERMLAFLRRELARRGAAVP